MGKPSKKILKDQVECTCGCGYFHQNESRETYATLKALGYKRGKRKFDGVPVLYFKDLNSECENCLETRIAS